MNTNKQIDTIVFSEKSKHDTTIIHALKTDGITEVKLEDIYVAAADYSLVASRLNYLTGRILTIIDASIADKTQNKAVKDLIRVEVSQEFEFFSDILLHKQIQETLESVNGMTDEEFEEHVANHPPVELSDIIAPGK